MKQICGSQNTRMDERNSEALNDRKVGNYGGADVRWAN